MGKYTIKDVEQLSGIKAHTIRIWEKRYNILATKRTDTNIRYYDDEDLKFILNISLLNNNGFKISKIAQLSKKELVEQIIDLTETSLDYDVHIDQLVVSMIEVDEGKFEKVLGDCIQKFEFENTMVKVIYPFLSKIGILWQVGSINPAQEHFISNLIRQKIIVAIDQINVKPRPESKIFLLFLRENELHEIGLLFTQYILLKNGHQVVYLGQNVPFNDLSSINHIRKPDYLVTSIINPMTPVNLKNYAYKLSTQFDELTILIFGQSFTLPAKDTPENITHLPHVDALNQYLEAM